MLVLGRERLGGTKMRHGNPNQYVFEGRGSGQKKRRRLFSVDRGCDRHWAGNYKKGGNLGLGVHLGGLKWGRRGEIPGKRSNENQGVITAI